MNGSWDRTWKGDGLGLLCGAVLPFAFAPFGWFWLAPCALGGLFVLCRRTTWRRSLFRGWCFGFGQFGLGVFWIAESFQYNHIPLVIAVLLTGLLVAGLAVFCGLCAAIVTALFGESTRWHLLWVWPTAWSLVETVRSFAFTGFTWLQVGVSQIDGPLGGWIPVLGGLGAGWLVGLSGGAIAALLVGPGRSAGKRVPGFALVLVVAMWLGGSGLGQVDWTTDTDRRLKVALIQGNVPQHIKWLPEQRGPTLRRYTELTAMHRDADLVIWPETAVPGLLHFMGAFLGAVHQDARATSTTVLAGIPSVAANGRALRNSVVVLGRGVDPPVLRSPSDLSSGAESPFPAYHKRKLVPFGEYLPWSKWLGPIMETLAMPVPNFSGGPARQPEVRVGNIPLGISVCYEIAFSREVLRSLPDVQLLVNVSNDAWFGESIGPHQHLEMARVRARESGRYLLRSTNTGISAIIAPNGNILRRAPQFKVATLAGEVAGRRGQTPFVKISQWTGPYAGYAFGAALLALYVWARARRGVR